MEAAISAWPAAERNRVLGQESSEEEEAVHVELVREAQGTELGAYKFCRVLKPLEAGALRKSAVGARRILTWEMVGGVRTVKVRQVATGFRGPVLTEGTVGTSGCTVDTSGYFRSSHLQVIPHTLLGKWELSSPDIKGAFLRADGFTRDVFLRAPPRMGILKCTPSLGIARSSEWFGRCSRSLPPVNAEAPRQFGNLPGNSGLAT